MDTNDDEIPPTREELLRAREDLQRQLDVLRHPFGFGRNRKLEGKLEAMVKDIDDCLAAMEPESPDG